MALNQLHLIRAMPLGRSNNVWITALQRLRHASLLRLRRCPQ
jgi:hypothetical protein